MTDKAPLYFIGDVHGCYEELVLLVKWIEHDAARRGREPSFMFLGDITDRGPESMRCMDLVAATLERHPRSRLHLGNHCAWFLDVLQNGENAAGGEDWMVNGGIRTVMSYFDGDLPRDFHVRIREEHPKHVEILRNAELLTLHGPLVAVHAGLDPALPFDGQGERTLTWMREPFLSYVDPAFGPVVHGHTILGPLPVVTENRFSIDTGAFHHGVLTCMAVDAAGGELFFVQSDGDQVREVRPKLVDRGHGTLMDRVPEILEAVAAAAVPASEPS